ncbi:hypothetical protein FS837_010335 [Tulasnella sp. UAMH 9824]|nr:hypothetical protein FS837_010335 [Tulasnella sp. UAMH 9824]
MEKPISTADVPGYIYCYELRDAAHEEIVHLKVGRAVNLVKRIDEWTKSCESKEPILRGWYPGPDTEEAGRVSMMKGVVTAGRKGANCHRLERLIHLELADLVINKPYLTDAFAQGQVKGTGKAPSQRRTNAPSKKAADDDDLKSTPKRKTRAAGGASASAKKKKAKAAANDDDDDEDNDDDDGDYDDDEDDDSSNSNGSKGSTGSTGKKGKTKGPKMAVRKPCKDCGQVHKEIFTFLRPTSGQYKNKEWERIVQPVMERWGTFIDYHT